jgi:hypothetical protein
MAWALLITPDLQPNSGVQIACGLQVLDASGYGKVGESR